MMTQEQLATELKLPYGFLSIQRLQEPCESTPKGSGCSLRLLQKALEGETVFFNAADLSCRGAATGLGFSDGIPDTPGGFGHFISSGRGEGYPPGERIKCSPQLGEEMLLAQPQKVMHGYSAICVQPYGSAIASDLVTVLANLDQISALIHLFNFRKAAYDNVIAPMSSGCASVFRIPFGELETEHPRAVIGNIDVFSRPHFGANTAFFTVSGEDFAQMLADAQESVLASHIWRGIKARL